MSRVLLNKSALAGELRRLARYREFLPALDLKRRQLLVEVARERATGLVLAEERAAVLQAIADQLPMLADTTIDLAGLVTVDELRVGTASVLGTPVPVLERVTTRAMPYSLLARPHWVDHVAVALDRAICLAVRSDICAERLRRLEAASRTMTRRVNLFAKVLIPRSEALIRQIRLALADADRYAAVRGKLAKKATLRRHAPGLPS